MEIFPIPCHYCDMTYQMQNIHTVIRYNVWKLNSLLYFEVVGTFRWKFKVEMEIFYHAAIILKLIYHMQLI
jgi:hypothetical protein